MQGFITDANISDHLTQNFTGMNLRVEMCLLLMVARSRSLIRFIFVAAGFAELADCTISSIRSAKLRHIFFTLDSEGVNCEYIDLEHTISSNCGPDWSYLFLVFFPR